MYDFKTDYDSTMVLFLIFHSLNAAVHVFNSQICFSYRIDWCKQIKSASASSKGIKMLITIS